MTSQNRRTDLEKVRELDHVEDLFAKGMSRRKVLRDLREGGIDDRTASRRVQTVFQRWVHESSMVTRDEKREHISEALWEVVRVAMNRTRLVPRSVGNFTTELVEHPDPDLKTAAVALETLGRLHGVFEQPDAGGTFGNEMIAKFQAFFHMGEVAGALAANTQDKRELELDGEVVK